jgi:hypothetical protein
METPFPYTVDSAALPPSKYLEILDKVPDVKPESFDALPKHWHQLIDESIKTLLWLRNDLAAKDLSSDAKTAIVKGFLGNLAEGGDNNEID